MVKLGTHVIFVEAQMSVPARKAPLSAEALQRVRYYNWEQWINGRFCDEFKADSSQHIQMQQMTPTAILPTRGTKDSIGLDLYSDMDDITILPDETLIFQTGIQAAAPPGTYLRVAPRSGLTIKKQLNTLAGVIDPDYHGVIGVVLHNFGKLPRLVKQKDRIAQLIVERAQQPVVVESKHLPPTARDANGFGSTDKKTSSPLSHAPTLPTLHSSPRPTAAATAAINFANTSQDLNVYLDMPFDIHLSSNPFNTFTNRYLTISGDHPTLGL
jgi:deoxyuridine 5'-triphosphate nucleotidohydrolase